MAHTANHSVPEQGFFRRALAAILAFEQAMDSTSFDYMRGRIERLEREVGRLKDELRQSRAAEISARTAQLADYAYDTAWKIA